MDNYEIKPPVKRGPRGTKGIQFSKKERALFESYAKAKGWPFSRMFRVCTRAVILLEYNKASTLEEAIKKSVLLDIGGRNRR